MSFNNINNNIINNEFCFDNNYQRFRPNYDIRHENRHNFVPNNSQNFQRFSHKRDYYYKNSNKRSFNNMNNDLSHHSINDTFIQSIHRKSEKSKYETIVIELNDKQNVLNEHLLRKEFTTYGSVKKVWFSSDRSKAFISFYNQLSVDMIVENGQQLTVNNIPLTVYPLKVIIPEEINSMNNSFDEKLIRSDNSNLRAKFPLKKNNLKFKNYKNELKDWIRTVTIDNNEVVEQVLKASDIEQQISVFMNLISLNERDCETRISIRDKLQEILSVNNFQCVLQFLGSTVNKLGFRDSDIDLFIEITEENTTQTKRISFEEVMHLLTQIHSILKRCLNFFIPKPIPSIRCPIIRLDFNHMIKEMRNNKIVCDLSLSNGLGPQNSKLIRVFCDIEPRFQQMTLILKYWAKINGFIGSNEMSSYAFTQLVIFFCQNTSPALLPTVDHLRQLTTESLVIHGWNCGFCDDINLIKQNIQQNRQSVFELLPQFFKFYSTFDFTTQVICTKTGLTRHKTTFISNNSLNQDLSEFKLTTIVCIEDPFELSHNLTSNLKYKVFHKFIEYLKYISINSKTIFNNKQENQNTKDWGISRIITQFDPTVTGYVFPENFVGFANLDLVLNTSESELSLNAIIQTMANNLSELTVFLLRDIYKIDYILLAKWDIIINELSPFAEFYVKFRGLDFQVIDCMNRQTIRSELNENDLKLNYFDRERLITERIIAKFNHLPNDSIVPIHCQFVFIMNSCINFPTFELAIVDIKPSLELGKGVIDFLKRVIACAANQQKLLTVNKDLI